MIWLIWQRYRLQASLGLLALVALTYLFVLDANILNAAFGHYYVTYCYNANGGDIPCGSWMIAPGNTTPWHTIATTVLSSLPFFVGIFLGAPLIAREYERRAYLFTWTQRLSRTRWLTIHLVILVGAILLSFGWLTLVTTWRGNLQSSPWNTLRGSVPVANALVSLMLGVMVGACIRRTLPAMAVTLLLLIPLQYAILFGLSPTNYSFSNPAQGFQFEWQDPLPGWKYVEPNGNIIRTEVFVNYCNLGTISFRNIQQCMVEYQLKGSVLNQPLNKRFWPLQIAATTVLLALAALFTAITYWQLQRRIL